MAEVDLISSHTPWAPLPRMLAPGALGDGSAYQQVFDQAATADAVWSDPARVKQAYADSVAYSLDALTSFVANAHDDNLVLVVLGDHQPAAVISGEGASHDVPVSVVAKDPAVLDRIGGWGWQPGLRPSAAAPVWPMDAFRDRFFGAFGDGSGREGLVAVVAALPRDATVDGERVERADVGHQLGSRPARSPSTPRACRARSAGTAAAVALLEVRDDVIGLRREETGALFGRGEHVGQGTAGAGRPDGAGVLDLLGVGGEEPREAVTGDAVGDGLVEVAERVLRGTSAHRVAACGRSPEIRPDEVALGHGARLEHPHLPRARPARTDAGTSFVSPEGLDGDRRKKSPVHLVAVERLHRPPPAGQPRRRHPERRELHGLVGRRLRIGSRWSSR